MDLFIIIYTFKQDDKNTILYNTLYFEFTQNSVHSHTPQI